MSTSAPPDARPRLAVLFVHGIGTQQRGATLTTTGDAICTWLQAWGRDHGLHAEIERADLQPQEGPPRCVLRIDRADGTPVARWTLAEAYWADAISSPRLRDLFLWGTIIFPWLSIMHVGDSYRRRVLRPWVLLLDNAVNRLVRTRFGARFNASVGRHPRVWQTFIAAVIFVPPLLPLLIYGLVALVATIVTLTAVLLLIVLAIPPVESLRNFVLRAQRAITGSVGDSYILLTSPVQRSAILERVTRALEPLVRSHPRVAVVAHSQGAAVAFQALASGVLRRYPTPGGERRAVLITYGSGLRKLEEIRYSTSLTEPRTSAGEDPAQDRVNVGRMAIGAPILLLLGLLKMLFPGVGPGGFVAGAIASFLFFILWAASLVRGLKNRFRPEQFTPEDRFGEVVAWRDYYASHDPVPNGPLMDDDPPYLRSTEVHNCASPLRDHGAYWPNREQFLPAVIGDLLECEGSGATLLHLDRADRDRLRLAAQRREFRTRTLQFVRLVVLASASLWVLASIGLFEPVGRIVLRPAVGLVDLLFDTPWWLKAHATALWAGLAAFVAAVAAGWWAAVGLCKLWETADWKALRERQRYQLGLPFVLFAGLACAVPQAVLLSLSEGERGILAGLPASWGVLAFAVWVTALKSFGKRSASAGESVAAAVVASFVVLGPAVLIAPPIARINTLPAGLAIACIYLAGSIGGIIWSERWLKPRLLRLAAVAEPSLDLSQDVAEAPPAPTEAGALSAIAKTREVMLHPPGASTETSNASPPASVAGEADEQRASSAASPLSNPLVRAAQLKHPKASVEPEVWASKHSEPGAPLASM